MIAVITVSIVCVLIYIISLLLRCHLLLRCNFSYLKVCQIERKDALEERDSLKFKLYGLEKELKKKIREVHKYSHTYVGRYHKIVNQDIH